MHKSKNIHQLTEENQNYRERERERQADRQTDRQIGQKDRDDRDGI